MLNYCSSILFEDLYDPFEFWMKWRKRAFFSAHCSVHSTAYTVACDVFVDSFKVPTSVVMSPALYICTTLQCSGVQGIEGHMNILPIADLCHLPRCLGLVCQNNQGVSDTPEEYQWTKSARIRASSRSSSAFCVWSLTASFVRFDIGKVNRWPLSPPALLGFFLSEQPRCIWHSRVASLWVFASLFFPFPISS